MPFYVNRRSTLKFMFAGVAAPFLSTITVGSVNAATAQLRSAIAGFASNDKDIFAFYKARDFKAVFVGKTNNRRLNVVLKAMANAQDHGLPAGRYNSEELKAMLRAAKTDQAKAQVEVETARRFLIFTDHMHSGVLKPRAIDKEIAIKVLHYDRLSALQVFAKSNPEKFIKGLAPKSSEYAALKTHKLRLEKLMAKGGWGKKVQARSIKPGEMGPIVSQLGDRLARMGYLRRSQAGQVYDANLKQGVQAFQRAHGLAADGVAGRATMYEINRPAEYRLQQAIVGMERHRWHNRPFGKKYIRVNIPDYHVEIIEKGKTTFRSRTVVGQNEDERRTPEFSDIMEFMVINPTWNVPDSIATKEYLPLLQEDSTAVSQLDILDMEGNIIDRSTIDFSKYSEDNFPFMMKQQPSEGNALGLVKFMFPNNFNIYLHDTPEKKLFGYQSRAFSHGCVRVHKPFDFAYALLKNQERNPQKFFADTLKQKDETWVSLKQPLPVHLIYFTAWVDTKGKPHYRRDIYGRDARIFSALSKAGVLLRAIQS